MFVDLPQLGEADGLLARTILTGFAPEVHYVLGLAADWPPAPVCLGLMLLQDAHKCKLPLSEWIRGRRIPAAFRYYKNHRRSLTAATRQWVAACGMEWVRHMVSFPYALHPAMLFLRDCSETLRPELQHLVDVNWASKVHAALQVCLCLSL